MALITYPLLTVRDDFGVIVSDATVTLAGVKDRAGTDIASPGVTIYRSGPNVSASYDAASKGEAWITLAISKTGSTITGWNASPSFYLAEDSSWLKGLANATPPPEGPPPGIILNFRSSLGYVTDAEGESAVLDTTDVGTLNDYSWRWTYAPGGWISDDSTASPYAPELAGCAWQRHNGEANEFVVTLPAAGTYDVGVALGTAHWTNNFQSAEIYDGRIADTGSTLVKTICHRVTTTAGEFVDIAGTVRTGTQWQTERTTAAITFATRYLSLRIASPPDDTDHSSDATEISCLIVRQSAS